MNVPPPPRPSALRNRPNVGTPVVTPPVSTARANRNFLWGFLAGVMLALLLAWAFTLATDDPYNGAPQCTDLIADTGGICHGDPVQGTIAELAEQPGMLVYTDGTWVNTATGATGCLPGAPCQ